MKQLKLLALLVLLPVVIAACASPPPPTPWRVVSSGVIATQGVEIRAEDGAFHWRSGQTFAPPIQLEERATWYSKNGGPDASKPCKDSDPFCRKVRVRVPGRAEELHGRFHMAKMHPDAIGPGARSYYIQVPQRYVDEASDGRISVVYEWVKHTDGMKQTGWVLWLSDRPF